eukprot:TRINITY_DN422_c0_g2_i4.p1 TRINITY_DN422_c0_g2~~TRINITY_DN422_c0_g2_i4.p1  ORF type:complete len:293 (-),score=40.44 TRINITY_DN422_c0_g2_i4:169-1047(-)
MTFPKDYPMSPPTLIFTSEFWHPNVYPDGKVCISILHPPGEDEMSGESAGERWMPSQNVSSILLSVISMLSDPNFSSPANVDASVEWRKKPADYKKRIKRLVDKANKDVPKDIKIPHPDTDPEERKKQIDKMKVATGDFDMYDEFDAYEEDGGEGGEEEDEFSDAEEEARNSKDKDDEGDSSSEEEDAPKKAKDADGDKEDSEDSEEAASKKSKKGSETKSKKEPVDEKPKDKPKDEPKEVAKAADVAKIELSAKAEPPKEETKKVKRKNQSPTPIKAKKQAPPRKQNLKEK